MFLIIHSVPLTHQGSGVGFDCGGGAGLGFSSGGGHGPCSSAAGAFCSKLLFGLVKSGDFFPGELMGTPVSWAVMWSPISMSPAHGVVTWGPFTSGHFTPAPLAAAWATSPQLWPTPNFDVADWSAASTPALSLPTKGAKKRPRKGVRTLLSAFYRLFAWSAPGPQRALQPKSPRYTFGPDLVSIRLPALHAASQHL